MSRHILYSFRRCPYAMRARFALIANKVNYEHREILLRNKPQSMLNYSPKGTVPVFVLNDGTVVDESLDVMKFAYNIEGDVDTLIHENDTFFKRNLDRYKYGNRFPEEGDAEFVSNKAYIECQVFLQKLEDKLEKQAYLSGDDFGFTDIAIFPFLRQFSKVDATTWESNAYPCLRKWLEGCLASSIFEKVMQKHPLWED